MWCMQCWIDTHDLVQEIMKDPVFDADGYTYDRESIQQWFDAGNRRSPMTGLELRSLDLTPNRAIKSAIHAWRLKHPLQ